MKIFETEQDLRNYYAGKSIYKYECVSAGKEFCSQDGVKFTPSQFGYVFQIAENNTLCEYAFCVQLSQDMQLDFVTAALHEKELKQALEDMDNCDFELSQEF